MQVRIGVADAPREIDLDVEDANAVAEKIEGAIADGATAMIWIVDRKGRRVGVPANRLAYIDIPAAERASVGFSA